jgi:hypothetical protein
VRIVDRAELFARLDLNMLEMYREIARATPGGFVTSHEHDPAFLMSMTQGRRGRLVS